MTSLCNTYVHSEIEETLLNYFLLIDVGKELLPSVVHPQL